MNEHASIYYMLKLLLGQNQTRFWNMDTQITFFNLFMFVFFLPFAQSIMKQFSVFSS